MWVQTLAPAAVAIVVPWLAFQYALRQDRQRWSRERRAEVYIDLLVEASAERDYLARRLALAEGLTPEDLSPFEDHRMNDLDRRRLGARVLAFGSREVIRRHNTISAAGFWALLEMRDPVRRHEAKTSNELASPRSKIRSAWSLRLSTAPLRGDARKSRRTPLSRRGVLR